MFTDIINSGLQDYDYKCEQNSNLKDFAIKGILYRFAEDNRFNGLKTRFMKEQEILIHDYDYDLPDERIAKYPLSVRDASKLLIYNKGIISENVFRNLPDFLPEGSMMVFNNTKVVPARLFFRKESGALIEIFCLEPVSPADYAQNFASDSECAWKVIIGNAKRWKDGKIYVDTTQISDNKHLEEVKSLSLKAELVEKMQNSAIVKFTWTSGVPFSSVLDICGRIPIPPYLHRDTELVDYERYQTLYALYRGSVAAPTAGLHFTNDVLSALKVKGIACEEVCLHVGAGTFLPVKSDAIGGHAMHSEPFSISLDFLKKLYNKSDNQKLISVGTTSTRTLESLYYLGLQCFRAGYRSWEPRPVGQWEPYEDANNEELHEMPSLKDVVASLIDYMEYRGLDVLSARTQIIIVPGYRFKVVDVLITNFHQPQSTLLLLVSAFVSGNWKSIYDYALSHDFRFLSYGDSSVLFR